MHVQTRTVALIIAAVLLVIGLTITYRAEAPIQVGDEAETASSTPVATSTASVSPAVTSEKPAPAVVKTPTKAVTPTVTSKQTTVASGRIAPELVKPTGFTNIDALDRLSTDPFTIAYWKGKKVILLEFWTTSSLNAEHTIPYLNRWHDRYKDDGLLIIAVHTPQFTYERSKAVVDAVARARAMLYPIVIDNEYGTWGAYKNTVWPVRYLIDMNGRIVYSHVGDGAFEATEAKIAEQLQILADAKGKSFTPETFQVPVNAYHSDRTQLGASEFFLGASRNSAMSNGTALKEGPQTFAAPQTVPLNTFAFTGSWTFTKEHAQNMMESSTLLAKYKAKGVYATLSAETYLPVKIFRDGASIPEQIAGKDVRYEKGQSVVYVKEARIYDLIQDSTYGEHTITLAPAQNGLRAFVLMAE